MCRVLAVVVVVVVVGGGGGGGGGGGVVAAVARHPRTSRLKLLESPSVRNSRCPPVFHQL